MNPDFIIYLTLVSGLLLGFVAGRMERKDSYTRIYRHGFNIGKQVGRNEGE
jgi:hypothetical protein